MSKPTVSSPRSLIIQVYDQLKLDKTSSLYKKLCLDFTYYGDKVIYLLDNKASLHNLTNNIGIMPDTYIIKRNDDFKKINISENEKSNIWFLKHSIYNTGKGVYIGTLQELEEIHKLTKISKIYSYVLQPEIKPFLINNKKFSIRCLVLILNGKLYIHKYGIIHLAPSDYEPNTSFRQIQLSYMERNNSNEIPFKNDSYEYYDEFFEKILTICKKLNICIKNKVDKLKKPYIIGMDIMIDHNRRAWLLELNVPPAMSQNGYIYEQVNYHVIRDIIYLYSDIMNKANGFIEI